MKIMIVDDERDVEILFRQQFRKEVKDGKVELCYAFSGEEALLYLRTVNPPDVVCILSDINMPGITGLVPGSPGMPMAVTCQRVPASGFTGGASVTLTFRCSVTSCPALFRASSR